MVGYRNRRAVGDIAAQEFIRHSDGGVSEQIDVSLYIAPGVYQAFRWWGIGTLRGHTLTGLRSLSGIPMVGYRNRGSSVSIYPSEFIRHSDGGVSERRSRWDVHNPRVYQAFRWWGIGTQAEGCDGQPRSLSGIPMVGYRNCAPDLPPEPEEFIRHSDGGVSELSCLSGGARR